VSGAFSARRSAQPDDLRIEVRGVGPLRLPVAAEQARALRAVARPARYGQGDRTLLDARVRDTWEIPKSRVKIDQRRWKKTLLPVLERLRADLGLPAGCRLRAELASMLVYAPGQFFAPHQDSEKGEGMLATLVVMLPGSSRGGSLVVEHAGQQVSYRSSGKRLAFVAFYADCRHEVRPLTSGHRVVLTYNLHLAGDTADAASDLPAVADATSQLADCLDGHFSMGSAQRLVYLLDHQYTAHGLSWARLKGADAVRGAALRAAAARADATAALALAEVHQTWECDDPDGDTPPRWRDDNWDDDEGDEEPDGALGPEGYELGELLVSETRLDRWIVDEPGAAAEPITAMIDDTEVCTATPSVNLSPHASEYEGYMGNEGNTMDHWYRRGAVVCWPRRDEFVVRAEASPDWALKTLAESLRDGDISQARERVAALSPFWNRVARPSHPWEHPGADGEQDGQQDRERLARALDVAAGLDDPALAGTLLAPFRVQLLTPQHASPLAGLGAGYGQNWTRDLLAAWSDPGTPRSISSPGWLGWMSTLAGMCAALRDTGDAGGMVAGLLLADSWHWLAEAIQTRRSVTRPTRREQALGELAPPIAALLEAAAEIDATALRDTALEVLRAGDDTLLPCLVQIQRATANLPATARAAAGLDTLAGHAIQLLQARLDEPPRGPDDYLIPAPGGCTCPLCDTLASFLTDPAQRTLEWPLAQKRRQHIHQRIEGHELPIRHQTRRAGRPYTLVLTKTAELFNREAQTRRQDHDDLTWLRKHTQ
jgi:predicted 2-oxoglutarate/Fe(II)-dependent dioxygenase YbiX